MTIELISSNKVFGGYHQRYRHKSAANNCVMTFAIYLPPQANESLSVPVLYWLSGLTCTDENFMQKAGALKLAAELGMAIVAPDTSPRGDDVPDDPEGSYDFGLGAGFYLNATQQPWDKHYHMYDYVVEELPQLIEANFNVSALRAVSGHSMGGHGALVVALRNPERYVSVSAFSPIVNPMGCAWGQKAFTRYLGNDEQSWGMWDSCELIKKSKANHLPVLIDQGLGDQFLDEQLHTQKLVISARDANYPVAVNMHEDYDHSYYFIASFIDKHLHHHAKHLFKNN